MLGWLVGWLPTYFSYRIKFIIVYYLLPSRHALVVLSRCKIDKGIACVALIVRRVAEITLHFI